MLHSHVPFQSILNETETVLCRLREVASRNCWDCRAWHAKPGRSDRLISPIYHIHTVSRQFFNHSLIFALPIARREPAMKSRSHRVCSGTHNKCCKSFSSSETQPLPSQGARSQEASNEWFGYRRRLNTIDDNSVEYTIARVPSNRSASTRDSGPAPHETPHYKRDYWGPTRLQKRKINITSEHGGISCDAPNAMAVQSI